MAGTDKIYKTWSGESLSTEQIIGMIVEFSGMYIDMVIDEKRINSNDIEDSYGSNRQIIKERKRQTDISLQKTLKHTICRI